MDVYRMPASDLSAAIRTCRQVRDLTQAQAAAEIGVSTRALRNWEKGRTAGPAQRRAIRRWLAAKDAA